MVAINSCRIMAMAWLLLASLWTAVPAMAAVTAQVDRLQIGEGETVNLNIDVTGDDSGDPDTAVLEKDFEILSRNHSSSYSLINGSIGSSASWQLVLRPRHAGKLIIPPIRVGQAHTRAITLQVDRLAARSAPGGQPSGDIWLDMQADPQTVFVQQQMIITIRIYQAVAMAQAQLTEPKAAHAIIERLGEDRQYQVMKSGRNWQVTERLYALFPQQSGALTIAPVQLDAAIIVNQQRFSSPMFQSSKPLRVRSNGLTLEVKPIPVAWTGADWLPASSVQIKESWPDSKSYSVGEPLTRTITLYAQGLSHSQLPALSTPLPDYLKAYPDQPVLSDDKTAQGIIGMRQEKTAIIPTTPGTYILPAIDLPWWNINTGKMETAQLPARSFKVIGAIKPAPKLQLPQVLPQPQSATGQQPQMSAEPVPAGYNWWKPVAIIAICGWLLTLLLWLLTTRRKPVSGSDSAQSGTSTKLKAAHAAVQEACHQNDAKPCEKALISFAAISWPQGGGGLQPLRALGDQQLNEQISLLEKCLYGAVNQPWQADALLSAFEQACQQNADNKSVVQPVTLPG
ncbi:MAG: BatD family protein, partial [Mariprofundus sp.]